jgi:hypothetical protein
MHILNQPNTHMHVQPSIVNEMPLVDALLLLHGLYKDSEMPVL